jgi:phosphatidylglycerol---prolipoprotein diacylglyceryl transferase
MIPYITHNSLPLGVVTIHLFGVLVACGILVGAWLTQKRGEQLGLERQNVGSMITTTLVFGFIISHIFDVFAYKTLGPGGITAYAAEYGWGKTILAILNPFGGLSSYGGFIGALIGLFTWSRFGGEFSLSPFRFRVWRREQPMPVMPYADSLGFGLAAGWAFGRAGCYTAHDHPGSFSDFFLTVPYPEGRRHDLGFDEMLWATGVTLLFLLLFRKNRPLGLYVALLTTLYGPVRFFLDYLRVTNVAGADPRYWGFTPAQYLSVGVSLVGIGLLAWTLGEARRKTAKVEA